MSAAVPSPRTQHPARGLRRFLAAAALALAAACSYRGSGPEPAAGITAPAALTAGQAGYQASIDLPAGATCAWTLANGSLLSPADGAAIRFAAGTDLGRPVTLACTVYRGAAGVQSSLRVPVHAGPVIQAPLVAVLNQGTQTLSTQAVAGASFHWTLAGGQILAGQDTPQITLLNVPSAASQAGRRALAASLTLRVTLDATYGSGDRASTTLDIPVQADNVHPPAGLAYTPASAVATVGQDLAALTPSSTGGSIGRFAIQPALPEGLAIDPATGFIAGRPTAASAATTYVVTATGAVLPDTATAQVTLTVAAAPATGPAAPAGFSYAPATVAGRRNVAIPALTPAFTGGDPAIAFSVTPDLPAGITLDPGTGVIAGTPTGLSGATVYTVTAGNAGGTATATVTLGVAESAPAPFSYGSGPVTLYVGNPLAPLVPAFAAGGGPATGFAISPALPAGLSFNTATGALAGTPTAPAPAAAYTVTASNAGGSAQAALTLGVAELAPPAFSYTPASQTLRVAVPMAALAPAFAAGGNPATSFTVSPALPARLALDPATGIITGIPAATAPLASYTVTAHNGAGQATATVAFDVALPATPTVVYDPAIVVAHKGVALAGVTPIAGVGGNAGIFSVTGTVPAGQSLPAGLAFDPATGTISGAPTGVQLPITYTVSYINNLGSFPASLTLSVEVAPPAAFSYTPASVTGHAGYPLAVAAPGFAAGGSPADSFSISPALPAGLALDPLTGAVAGVPQAAAAAATYTVTASNGAGASSATLDLAVDTASSYPRFVYAGNGDGTLAIYTVEPQTSQLRIHGLADLGAATTPSLLAVSPDNRFLAVADQANNVLAVYALDPDTGRPSLVGSPQNLNGQPAQILFEPSGAHLFVAWQTLTLGAITGGSIDAYAVAADGSLGAATSLAPGTLGAGTGPLAMAADPLGRHLVLMDSANQVRDFRIVAGGALTQAGSVLTGWTSPPVLAIDPAGQSLYILSASGSPGAYNEVADIYGLTAGGLVSQTSGVNLGTSYPLSAAFDPSGAHLFLFDCPNPAQTSGQQMTVLAVGAGGSLSTVAANGTPMGTRSVLVDSTGHQVYALADSPYGTYVGMLQLDLATSQLTDIGSVNTRPGPTALALVSGPTPVRHTPAFAYALNAGDHTISGYSADASSGALAPLAPQATWPADSLATSLALHPSGTFLYQYGAGTGTLTTRAIAGDGSLSAPVTSATGLSGVGAFAVDPSGTFAALLAPAAGVLEVFRLDPATGGLDLAQQAKTATLAPGATGKVVFDPMDRFIYVQAGDLVRTFGFDWQACTDNWQPGVPLAATGGVYDTHNDAPYNLMVNFDTNEQTDSHPVDMAVTPSGYSLVVAMRDAANAGPSAILMFEPDPATGDLFESYRGDAGIGLTSLAMDPLDVYIYAACTGGAANPATPGVYAWWLDSAEYLRDLQNYNLSGLQNPTLANTSAGVTGAAADPSGRFLFLVDGTQNTITTCLLDRDTGDLTVAGSVATGPGARSLVITDRLQ